MAETPLRFDTSSVACRLGENLTICSRATDDTWQRARCLKAEESLGLFNWVRKVLRIFLGPNRSLPDGVSVHHPAVPKFTGEQQGTAADMMSAKFREELVTLPQVQRAYLCKLRYSKPEEDGTAVCLAASSGEDLQVVQALADIIRDNLDASSHMDILFLTPTMEVLLSKVCSPFYQKGD